MDADAPLLAPLALAELERLEDMLYRAFSRLGDEGEKNLNAMESFAPYTLQYRQLLARAKLAMDAMGELHDLHGDAYSLMYARGREETGGN